MSSRSPSLAQPRLPTSVQLIGIALLSSCAVTTAFFVPHPPTVANSLRFHRQQQQQQHRQGMPLLSSSLLSSSVPSDVSTQDDATATSVSLDDWKASLVRACTRSSGTGSTSNNQKPLLDEIQLLVQNLEAQAELVGRGQAAALSGLLAGEWELLYSPDDLTRSSPFFWAFAQAFPENADQIFGITDAIPAPIKEVGPATQTIELSSNTSPITGKLVSRVKVATLNGMAASIMTTRADITGAIGVDGLKVRVDTTKPEESTVLQKLPPPLNTLVMDALPAFPSGQALEQVMPGSSTVIMRTTFCDDGLRISRNDAKYDEVFVWRRKKFAGTQDF